MNKMSDCIQPMPVEARYVSLVWQSHSLSRMGSTPAQSLQYQPIMEILESCKLQKDLENGSHWPVWESLIWGRCGYT